MQPNKFTQMLYGLEEEECTKFRKQKMKKEKINAAKSVGRDEKVSYDIKPREIFLPYLNRF